MLFAVVSAVVADFRIDVSNCAVSAVSRARRTPTTPEEFAIRPPAAVLRPLSLQAKSVESESQDVHSTCRAVPPGPAPKDARVTVVDSAASHQRPVGRAP